MNEGVMTASGLLRVSRSLLLILLTLELFSTLERQVFDFLGYMWLPILLNFFNILLVILGLFGVLESRLGYLRCYLAWSLLWLAWNAFLICFYKNIGSLNNSSQDLLSMGTGSFSWWFVNGLGCRAEYAFNSETPNFRPSKVMGCKMSYEDVEVVHAGIQIVLGALGLALGAVLTVSGSQSRQGNGEKGSSTGGMVNSNMYSIEYSPKTEVSNINSNNNHVTMTPRRIKRRSAAASASGNARSSVRFNRSKRHSAKAAVNPVNRLISQVESSSYDPTYDGGSSRPNSLYGTMIGGPAQTIRNDRCPSSLTSYSNFHQQRPKPNIGQPGQPGTHLLTQELLNPEDEGDELPLPPPPPEASPRKPPSGNYVNVPGSASLVTPDYCDTQTLYAGDPRSSGAIPKRVGIQQGWEDQRPMAPVPRDISSVI